MSDSAHSSVTGQRTATQSRHRLGGTGCRTRRPSCYRLGRIGINAHLLAEEDNYRRAGVSRYIYNLLVHVPLEDPEGNYTAFLNDRSTLSLPCRQRRTRLPTHRPWVRILWEQFLQPWEVQAAGISLLHSPVNVQPLSLPCPGVVTVTDLSFMFFPESFRTFQRIYQKVFTRWSAHRAAHLIAYSTSTARDLVTVYRIPSDKITVIFPGVDAAYRPVRDERLMADFRQKHNLPQRFILFVGTLEPRKNLLVLLQAYEQLKHRAMVEHKLVLGGGKGWLHQPVFEAVEQLGLQDDVIFPGFIPEDELPLWYNAADLFVYPSLYEGFGLPPLEAMACGTPVVVSSASSLPEVVGDAGILVDPQCPEEWTDALAVLCQDAALRADLGWRGQQRAQRFSWTRMAQETVRVYKDVLLAQKMATLRSRGA